MFLKCGLVFVFFDGEATQTFQVNVRFVALGAGPVDFDEILADVRRAALEERDGLEGDGAAPAAPLAARVLGADGEGVGAVRGEVGDAHAGDVAGVGELLEVLLAGQAAEDAGAVDANVPRRDFIFASLNSDEIVILVGSRKIVIVVIINTGGGIGSNKSS